MTAERMARERLLEKSGATDLLREAAAFLLQRLMELEVEAEVGAGRYERSADRRTWRSGTNGPWSTRTSESRGGLGPSSRSSTPRIRITRMWRPGWGCDKPCHGPGTSHAGGMACDTRLKPGREGFESTPLSSPQRPDPSSECGAKTGAGPGRQPDRVGRGLGSGDPRGRAGGIRCLRRRLRC